VATSKKLLYGGIQVRRGDEIHRRAVLFTDI
jgi:hypothetical protein